MSVPAFTLSVPTDSRFRGLAADVVRAYLALTKRTSPEADALVASVVAAVDAMAGEGTDVEVQVDEKPSGVDVRLSCAGRQETLHAAL
jgi:hypothetical protein